MFGIGRSDWAGYTLSQRLSFFTRVNLRHAVEEVSRLGYPVEHRKIIIPADPG